MQGDRRLFLVLTDTWEKFRTYMEKQYGVEVRGGTRSAGHNGNWYVHAYRKEDVRGVDPEATVIVLDGGRLTGAYMPARERFADIRYRETLP